MKKMPVFLSLAAFLMLTSSCLREQLGDNFVSVDEGLANNSFDEVQSIVYQEAANNGFAGFTSGSSGTFKTASDCPEVSFTAPMGTFPNTMTIDFGTACTSYYGVERSGKIISTFTGPYAATGTIITTNVEDYYVNGHHIEGSKTVTNMGTNDAGNIWFAVEVADGHITLESGEEIFYEESRQREWIEGADSLPVLDDVYLITGSGSGINRMDIPFTMEIVEPIRKEMDCRWPVSGVKEISPEDHPLRSVNFGDGACDNIIVVTVDGTEYEISLPL